MSFPVRSGNVPVYNTPLIAHLCHLRGYEPKQTGSCHRTRDSVATEHTHTHHLRAQSRWPHAMCSDILLDSTRHQHLSAPESACATRQTTMSACRRLSSRLRFLVCQRPPAADRFHPGTDAL